MLVHPDKCSHVHAAKAFSQLQKAYNVLKSPQNLQSHAGVISAKKKHEKTLFGWLDQKMVMLTPYHALMFIAIAAVTQGVVSTVLNNTSHEENTEDLQRHEGLNSGKTRAPQVFVGPRFSSDSGKVLVGHTREEFEVALKRAASAEEKSKKKSTKKKKRGMKKKQT